MIWSSVFPCSFYSRILLWFSSALVMLSIPTLLLSGCSFRSIEFTDTVPTKFHLTLLCTLVLRNSTRSGCQLPLHAIISRYSANIHSPVSERVGLRHNTVAMVGAAAIEVLYVLSGSWLECIVVASTAASAAVALSFYVASVSVVRSVWF